MSFPRGLFEPGLTMSRVQYAILVANHTAALIAGGVCGVTEDDADRRLTFAVCEVGKVLRECGVQVEGER